MTFPENHPKPISQQTALPKISRGVLALFRSETPSLEAADDKLRTADPVLAEFLLARAGELAPTAANMQQREVIARLALEAYCLLATQSEVDSLEAALGPDASTTVDSA